MSVWYYVKVRRLDDKSWLGWLGWSPKGLIRFNGEETDQPSKLSNVTYVNEVGGTPQYMRAPDYHAHSSACLGGVGDNGYYAAWKWGEDDGFKLTVDARGVVKNDNNYTLSVYRYINNNDASWEPHEKDAVTFEFAEKVITES
jgi:hypothetical protein